MKARRPEPSALFLFSRDQRITSIRVRLPPLQVYRVSAPLSMSPEASKAIGPVTPL